jgi:hypothetical protein
MWLDGDNNLGLTIVVVCDLCSITLGPVLTREAGIRLARAHRDTTPRHVHGPGGIPLAERGWG